jgi:pentatricopeptide repeat protein
MEQGVQPDEETCLGVLNLCGHKGWFDMALQAISALQRGRHPLKEYHVAPLVEAFSNAGRVSEAIQAVGMMRGHGIDPLPSTCEPLVTAMGKSQAHLDAGALALDDLRREGKPVDLTVANALIEASIRLTDLPRALQTYKDLNRLGLAPNARTFDALLSGCVSASQIKLAHGLWTEMSALGIPPTQDTREHMLLLSLARRPDPDFEDAFERLEALKASGLIPSRRVYVELAFALVGEADPRGMLVVEEMEAIGHRPSRSLRDRIKNDLLIKRESVVEFDDDVAGLEVEQQPEGEVREGAEATVEANQEAKA